MRCFPSPYGLYVKSVPCCEIRIDGIVRLMAALVYCLHLLSLLICSQKLRKAMVSMKFSYLPSSVPSYSRCLPLSLLSSLALPVSRLIAHILESTDTEMIGPITVFNYTVYDIITPRGTNYFAFMCWIGLYA